MSQVAPTCRHFQQISLVGRMVVYDSHASLVEQVPDQWRRFLRSDPKLPRAGSFYGASPCSDDGKIHYFTGVPTEVVDSVPGEPLLIPAGEYAVVEVADPSTLRQTWIWLLESWLPNSGRRERKTPEFENYNAISPAGEPVGVVEVCIPLESSE